MWYICFKNTYHHLFMTYLIQQLFICSQICVLRIIYYVSVSGSRLHNWEANIKMTELTV